MNIVCSNYWQSTTLSFQKILKHANIFSTKTDHCISSSVQSSEGAGKLLAYRIWECRRKCQSNFSVWSWITADLSLGLIWLGPSGQRGSAQKETQPQTHQTCHCHKYRGAVTAHELWLFNTSIKEDLLLRLGQKSDFVIRKEQVWGSCDSFQRLG